MMLWRARGTIRELVQDERIAGLLRRAISQAARLGHAFIAPAHITLGVLRDERSEATTILRAAGFDVNAIALDAEEKLREVGPAVPGDSRSRVFEGYVVSGQTKALLMEMRRRGIEGDGTVTMVAALLEPRFSVARIFQDAGVRVPLFSEARKVRADPRV